MTAHVLIIDDQPQLRGAIARIIKPLGHEITFAESAEEALELLMKTSFDLIISDIKMPGLDGIQLLRHIRDSDDDLPVILVTGDPSVESATAAVALRAFRYMSKPLDAAELKSAVRKAVGLRQVAMLSREQRSSVQETRDAVASAIQVTDVAYQPIVDRNREVMGYEVLARCPLVGYESPLKLVADAERFGLLGMLGARVRKLAVERRADRKGLLFINIHPLELNDTQLGEDAVTADIADQVVFEVTERASLGDIPLLRARIDSLRGRGFRFAVDDLGSGYSALSSIVELDPEFVKLDLLLIRGVHESERQRALISGILTTCSSLGIKAIAECVEEEAEFEVLEALGCVAFQGYLFGRPQLP